jgi:hypothetical protein
MQHPAAVSRTIGSSTLVSRPVTTQNILSGIQKSYHSEVSKSAILLPEVLLDEGSHALHTSQDETADKFLASNPSVKEVGGNGHVRVVTETEFVRLQQTVSDLQHQLLLALGERESRSETSATKSNSLPHELSETRHLIEIAGCDVASAQAAGYNVLSLIAGFDYDAVASSSCDVSSVELVPASPPNPVSNIVEVVFRTLSHSHRNQFFSARVALYSGQVLFFVPIQRLF